MARRLDLGRSWGEHRGSSHHHVYQQVQDGIEYYFDSRGRECDPHTGDLSDPSDVGWTPEELRGLPPKRVEQTDIDELRDLIKAQQAQIAELMRVRGDAGEPPRNGSRDLQALKMVDLRSLADELGVPHSSTMSKADLTQRLKEAGA